MTRDNIVKKYISTVGRVSPFGRGIRRFNTLSKSIKERLRMGDKTSGDEDTSVDRIERTTDMPGVSELVSAYNHTGEVNIDQAEADLDRSDNTRSVLSSDE